HDMEVALRRHVVHVGNSVAREPQALGASDELRPIEDVEVAGAAASEQRVLEGPDLEDVCVCRDQSDECGAIRQQVASTSFVNAELLVMGEELIRAQPTEIGMQLAVDLLIELAGKAGFEVL